MTSAYALLSFVLTVPTVKSVSTASLLGVGFLFSYRPKSSQGGSDIYGGILK